jgi:4-amino-4-deoxy-L-arabinose transferase-like glycosyltransferase
VDVHERGLQGRGARVPREAPTALDRQVAAALPLSPSRVGLASLLALFVLGLWPLASSFLLHYVDERNYTNAAITMVRTGDWVTPRWADGEPRLHKPIVTYWTVAAAYRVFGVSLPASRLPFVVAGALVVALAYALGRLVSGRDDVALLAATMTLSQPQVILASVRSIPDVLLCLFMLVSACGFVALLARDDPPRWAPWAAYGGAALAVATKGLLAALFVGYVWAFALLAGRGSARRLRPLLHVPSLAVGVVVAGWWYVLMYRLHGERLLRVFGRDQVSANLDVGGQPWLNVPAYLGLLLLNLLPWSLLLVPLLRRGRAALVPGDARERRVLAFLVGWSVVMAVVFGFGPLDARYVLPAGPVLAVVLATLVTRADPTVAGRAMRSVLALVLVVMAAVGVAMAALHVAAGRPVNAAATLALYAAVAATLALALRDARWLTPATAIALAAFLLFPLTAIALEPVIPPEAGARAMARDLERRRDPSAPVLMVGSEGMSAKLRILTGGRVPIEMRDVVPPRETWPATLILLKEETAGRDLAGYRTREVASEVRRVPIGPMLQAIRARQVLVFLDARRDRYELAIRR